MEFFRHFEPVRPYRRSIEAAFILVLSIAVLAPGLDRGSLSNYNEAIYAEVSKEMFQGGDWLTLHYSGEGVKLHNSGARFFEKPPLLFWLVAGTFKFFGATTLAARFWPCVFGIGTVVVTFILVRLLAGPREAFICALILLTSPQFAEMSRKLEPDTGVTFFTALSAYLLILARTRKNAYYLLGVSLGLCVLMKQSGILSPALLLLFLLYTRDGSILREGQYAKVLFAFILVVFPWHIIQVALHGSKFLQDYWGYHVLTRFYSPIEGKGYSNAFYVDVLFKGLGYWFFPFLISVPYLLYDRRKDKASALWICWLTTIFFIMFLAKTKLPQYLLPAYPAISASAAHLFSRADYKGFRLGVVVFSLILAASLKQPEPLNSSEPLYNIALAAQGNLRVHNSVGHSPAETFYLGVGRYKTRGLMESNESTRGKRMFYVSSAKAFPRIKGYLGRSVRPPGFVSIRYRDRRYVMFQIDRESRT